jgi:uncharacterized protein YlzI (FlbEa/FlbD family)
MILELTNLVDGTKIALNAMEIQDVREYPAGQTWIEMKDGTTFQVQEDVDRVLSMWKEILV